MQELEVAARRFVCSKLELDGLKSPPDIGENHCGKTLKGNSMQETQAYYIDRSSAFSRSPCLLLEITRKSQ